MKIIRFLAISIFVYFLACNVSVNKTIHIAQGQRVEESQSTVNGGIIIEADCIVRGNCRSVNGPISVGNSSSVGSLHTVNGPIKLGSNTTVEGSVETVNGSVTADSGARVSGKVETINGTIELTGAGIGDGISTYNGNISIRRGSVVKGDIYLKRSSGQHDTNRSLEIEISDNSTVEGGIFGEESNIKAKVHLSNGGKVNGEIKNAEVVKE